MRSITTALLFNALGVTLAIAILELLMFVTSLFCVDVFANFPLLPFTVIRRLLGQLLATKFRQDRHIDRRSVAGITLISLDALIASAIGARPLAALGVKVSTLTPLTVIAVSCSAFGLLHFEPRIQAELV